MSLNYNEVVKKSLPSFIGSRLIPTLGISAVFLLMAHKIPADLAVFSYVLAAASVVSAFSSLLLATAGNKAAALTHRESALSNLFTGGFTLALFIAVLTSAICLVVTYLLSTSGTIQHWDRETFWTLSLIYVASTPLLVINSFLQLFLEATGKASQCTRGKTLITVLSCLSLTLIFTLVNSHALKYYAMSYFFVIELLTLIFLIRLSRGQRYYSLMHAKKNSG
jgi:hypothetical protein